MISIIIPVYNTEKYLRRCIDSVLAQTYRDIEVIIVDDGSTDGSGKICDEYAALDNRVRVIHKANAGVAEARNTGLDEAKGDYIGFIDSDDYIEPEMYEQMLEVIISENAPVCCCGFYEDYGNDVYTKGSSELVVYSGTESIFRAYFRQDYDTGFGNGNWNKLFRKDVIKDIHFKHYTNGEDIDFQCNIFRQCNKIVCIPNVLYHYMCKDNEDSATNRIFNSNYLSVLRVADYWLVYAKNNYPDILSEAYAFHLTWYMAVLQKIYECGSRNIKRSGNAKYIETIRKEVKINKKYYSGNRYTKRLDKYYMHALLYNCMPIAILFRAFVRFVRKLISID